MEDLIRNVRDLIDGYAKHKKCDKYTPKLVISACGVLWFARAEFRSGSIGSSLSVVEGSDRGCATPQDALQRLSDAISKAMPKPRTCSNCKHWDNYTCQQKCWGICSQPVAVARTYNRLKTHQDFGCIFFEENKDG